jgi:hypothetical protein
MLLNIETMDVEWIQQWKLKFKLGKVVAALSATGLVTFNLATDQVLRCIARLVKLLRTVKELKYGPVPSSSDPPTELEVEGTGLVAQIDGLECAMITSGPLKYISTSSFSEYTLQYGRLMLTLSNENPIEVMKFDTFVYRLERDAPWLSIDLSYKALRVLMIDSPLVGESLNGLIAFTESYLLAGVKPMNSSLDDKPTIYRVKCDSIEISLSSLSSTSTPSDVSMSPCIKISIIDVSMTYDCSSSFTQQQNDLRRLDRPSNIRYHKPFGGKLKLNIGVVKIGSIAFGTELISLDRLHTSGLLYTAGVDHACVKVSTELQLLISRYLRSDVRCYLLQELRSAPRKIYSELQITLEAVKISYSDIAAECLPISKTIIDTAFESKSAPISLHEPLQSWDALRYWWHGSVILSCNSLSLRYILSLLGVSGGVSSSRQQQQQQAHQVQLRLSLDQVKLEASHSEFQLRLYNFIVNLRRKASEGVKPFDAISIPGRVDTVRYRLVGC